MKKRKRIFSFILSLVMVLGMMPMTSFTVLAADEATDDYVYEAATNTYTVYIAEGLYAWNKAVRAELSPNLILGADITLTGENNWTPMGYFDYDTQTPYGYTGIIDGKGHTITGLHINKSEDDLGFVNVFGLGGVVKNLIFKDATIVGGEYISIVVSNNYGTVSNCRQQNVQMMEE